MKVLLCPSSAAPPAITSTGATNGMYLADYKPTVRVANSGTTNLAGPNGLLAPAVQLTTPSNNGIMQTNSKVTFTSISDGSSNTILIAESVGGSQTYREG